MKVPGKFYRKRAGGKRCFTLSIPKQRKRLYMTKVIRNETTKEPLFSVAVNFEAAIVIVHEKTEGLQDNVDYVDEKFAVRKSAVKLPALLDKSVSAEKKSKKNGKIDLNLNPQKDKDELKKEFERLRSRQEELEEEIAKLRYYRHILQEKDVLQEFHMEKICELHLKMEKLEKERIENEQLCSRCKQEIEDEGSVEEAMETSGSSQSSLNITSPPSRVLSPEINDRVQHRLSLQT